jgi:hypothetical protein
LIEDETVLDNNFVGRVSDILEDGIVVARLLDVSQHLSQ